MGNYIGTTIVDVQEKSAGRMARRQFAMQCRAQDRMRRVQMAQAIAIARERVWWFATALGGVCYGAFAYKQSVGYFPRVMLGPIGMLGLVTAYQFDFAYGGKPERVNRIFNSITDERSSTYWFVPLAPPLAADDEDPAVAASSDE